MLVLTRKTNEELVIGGDVRVVVLGVQGSRVRLGISAPDGFRILRGELPSDFDAHDFTPPVHEKELSHVATAVDSASD